MPDPNALLSTLSQSSAAMVAIIGGFLVSRLVALSSEREGIKRQITSARQRLARIKKEYKPVHEYRLENSKSAFLGFVLDKLVEAEAEPVDYANLVSENIPRGSSMEEMLPCAKELHASVQRAYKNVLDKLKDNDRDDLSVSDLQKRGLKVPEEDEPIYEEVVDHIARKLPSAGSSFIPMPTMRVGAITPGWTHEVDARRLDESIREEHNLESQLFSAEQELKHLEKELEKIAKPVGVMPAVFILAALSIVGILFPVIVMATDPTRLSSQMKVLLIGLFAAGLIGVLGYILWYLKQLQSEE